MNSALLMKQLWRLSNSPNLLFSKVLKEKYFRGGCVKDVVPRASNSFAWKSLCSVLRIFLNGCNWDLALMQFHGGIALMGNTL